MPFTVHKTSCRGSGCIENMIVDIMVTMESMKPENKFVSNGFGVMTITYVSDMAIGYRYDFGIDKIFIMTWNDFVTRFRNLLRKL